MDVSAVDQVRIGANSSGQQRDGQLEQLTDIFKKQLTERISKKIVLVGERGLGKTWMAKRLSERAMREKRFHYTIWILLSEKHSKLSLCECIARQLSLIFTDKEWEDKDEDLFSKAPANKIRETLEGKKILLVFDDEGSVLKEADIWGELELEKLLTMKGLLPKEELLLPKEELLLPKTSVLITSVENDSPVKILVKSLSEEESLFLAEKKMGKTFDECPAIIKNMGKAFVKELKGLPAKIIMWAKVFSYFEKHESGLKKLEGALEEAFKDEKYDIVQLVWSADSYRAKILIDCCWGGSHFFRGRGGVHYNELITYWILEGYLGHVDSIRNSYEAGHRVLMDLIDFRMLKELETGYVILFKQELDLYALLHPGFAATARLGLATVFDPQLDGFGSIKHGDGFMKTVCTDKDGQYVSTLLIDGNHLMGEVQIDDEHKQKRRVLSLFNSTLKSLSSLLSGMDSLRVLVLRGCDMMEDVKDIPELKNLTVLEISGTSSVESFPDNFFDKMPNLRSLNLSGLHIKSLPNSLYGCSQLQWLILRKLPKLEALGNIQKLTNLVVLDLSDSASLSSITDKHFLTKKDLHTINLSNTRIKIIPIVKDLENLTHLFLSDCADMGRLRGLASLNKLQVLYLANSRKFKEFHDQSFGTMNALKVIDLSGCSITRLPANISNPSYLYLRCCSRLKKLFTLEILKALEVLDVSGSRRLVEIENDFFNNLTRLRILKLSDTIVKSLPSVSSLCCLRELVLSHCESLEKLEGLNPLTHLELIDLSHCSSLADIEDNSFQHMSHLQTLNLSNTRIKGLPDLSKATNLRCLILKKCMNIESLSLPNLSKLEELNLCGVRLSGGAANFVESMCDLKILDLSGTNLEKLPSMSNLKVLIQLYIGGCLQLHEVKDLCKLTELQVLDLSGTGVSKLENLHYLSNLRQLLMKDCSNIEDLPHPSLIDLLKPTVSDLPCGISNLAKLELLDLPRKDIKGSDTTKNPPEYQNRREWIISSWPGNTLENDNKQIIYVSDVQFLDLFEGNCNSSIFQGKIHFLICPFERKTTFEKCFYTNELIFRHMWLTMKGAQSIQRTVELRGFESYPKGVEKVLGHAQFVVLIDNPCIRYLPDSYVNSIKKLEGCWIERCNEMDCVVRLSATEKSGQQIKENAKENDSSETIGRDLQVNMFNNLKYFYLDCCPKLSKVFPSSQRLENLKVLEIKFCAELVTLFEEESAEVPQLQTLHLWALPKLKAVGAPMPARCSLRVGECPLLSLSEQPKDTVIWNPAQNYRSFY